VVRRAAIAGSVLNPVGYKILIEVLARGKVSQIAEVAYVFCERHQVRAKSQSKQYVVSAPLSTVALASGRMGRFTTHRFPRSVHPLWF